MTSEKFEQLTSFARKMRAELAPAESLLWERFRSRQVGGFKWRRQQPRNGFVTDFYCPECRPVLELDGDSHTESGAATRDLRRTAIIERDGAHVIRFVNTDVFDSIDLVLAVILEWCNRLKSPSP
ncbi:MAG: endonuclease domain-containing protein [Anaerolineae bacterium]|nr:endonuclease domain-containing protein [Phycisphaerae bacterium]